jgi:hypothetical protein
MGNGKAVEAGIFRAPRRFAWYPTVRIAGLRRARCACGQAGFELWPPSASTSMWTAAARCGAARPAVQLHSQCKTGCSASGGTWTDSSSRSGCTPTCRAWPAAVAARRPGRVCRGRDRARASRQRSRPWRCAGGCRCARPPHSCAAMTSRCGGASSAASIRRMPRRASKVCGPSASTRPACAVASTASGSCTIWMPGGCCWPAKAQTIRGRWTSTCTSGPTGKTWLKCGMSAWT